MQFCDRSRDALREGGRDFVDVYLDECHLHVARRQAGWRVAEYIAPIGLA